MHIVQIVPYLRAGTGVSGVAWSLDKLTWRHVAQQYLDLAASLDRERPGRAPAGETIS